MKLHYNQDGSISMVLNLKGDLIIKNFYSYQEYLNYLTVLDN